MAIKLGVDTEQTEASSSGVVPIKIIVTLNVPKPFLRNIENNTALIRSYVDDMAIALYGTVQKVDIS